LVEIDIEELRKRYPNLYKELMGSRGIKLRFKDPLRGFQPGAIDFIRRAETKEQALEVIDYMEKKGEIPHDYAEELRDIINKHGPRFFGEKKEDGYYLKKYWMNYQVEEKELSNDELDY
jgi:hypothetical protein